MSLFLQEKNINDDKSYLFNMIIQLQLCIAIDDGHYTAVISHIRAYIKYVKRTKIASALL